MRYCTECGEQLSSGLNFCTECGAAYETFHPEQSLTVQPMERAVNKVPKQPMSKRKKWMLGVGVTLGVLLIGVHLFLSSYYDPMKTLQEMDEAVAGDDKETFLSYIDVNKDAEMDEASYFQYIKSSEWEGIRDQYIALLEEDEESNYQLSRFIYSYNGEKLFHIKKDSKLIFYKTYIIQAVPTELIVSANMEDTEITIHGTTITLADTAAVEFGQFYPGTYAFHAKADGVYGSFSEESDLEIRPSEEREIAIEFEGQWYSFSTNKEDGYLFVNGENTGKTFGELGEIGPVPYDSAIEMHGEWENADGEVIQTDTLTMNDYGWYGFDFYFEEPVEEVAESVEEVEEAVGEQEAETEEQETEEEANVDEGEVDTDSLGDIVLNFRDAYEAALNSKDFSFIEPYLEPGSKAYDDLWIYIDDLKDASYHYNFQENDILKVEQMERESFLVTTNEIFVFTNHLGEEIDYDRTKEYVLVESGGGFKISDIYYLETNRDY